MITKLKDTFRNFENSRGFTLVELCMVIAIIGILATVAIKTYMDSRRHMADAAALAEAQGLGKAVLNSFIDDIDVDLTHNVGDAGRRIGELDTSGNARKPIFELSPAIEADITGSSDWGGSGSGFVSASFRHPLGTKDYIVEIDEQNAVTLFPDF